MRILICSDGTDPADKPARMGGLVGGACHAQVTLLGIAEQPGDEPALRGALESEAQLLGKYHVEPEIVLRGGEPIDEILKQTSTAAYDLVVVGARMKQPSGRYWRSHRTYEVIKAIRPPVLVASGDCERMSNFLVCTGGKRYIDAAVQLTGRIASSAGASVTLLHVMAEPPAIFADLVRREEDVDALLAAGSELGRNLRKEKENLATLGVAAQVRVRHGIVLDEVFAEVREGGHDMIVTGSSQARGTIQHYIMGDLTRSILNHADIPVLVARPGTEVMDGGIWSTLKRAFSSAPGSGTGS